jgi:hypothetical protein
MTILDDLPDAVWAAAFGELNQPITDTLAAKIADDIRGKFSNADGGLEKAVSAWIKDHPDQI